MLKAFAMASETATTHSPPLAVVSVRRRRVIMASMVEHNAALKLMYKFKCNSLYRVILKMPTTS